MPNSDFNAVLKTVSRSFYLSMRVLPKAMRDPIAIAYLLARAADTLADTATIPTSERLALLLNFKTILNDPNTTQNLSLNTFVNSVNHAGEQKLLNELPAVFTAYQNLSPMDLNEVKKVVNTLTTGMENDLQYFTKTNKIKALTDDEALEDYTYHVAGCVGEFWTTLSIIHTPSLSHWQKEKMSQTGIEFGKALQLTNILRDISKDAALSRCYLPATDLQTHDLNTAMLLDKNNNSDFKPIVTKWLKQADLYFDSAENYLLSIPRSCLRLRLAALWPILIGLATLKRIREKENFLDADTNVKVERKWVYKMLILSIPAAFSNTLLRYWVKSLKQ